jgi:flagellar basal body rod protein FlgG
MDNLSIAAVSGLRSRMQSLDLLANNLANSATSGFKIDREFYGVYSSDDSQNSVDGGGGATLPTIEKQWTDFSPGVIETTGNPLDFALMVPPERSIRATAASRFCLPVKSETAMEYRCGAWAAAPSA